MTLKVIWNFDILTWTFDLETYLHIFSIQALIFECLQLTASFSVWGYIFWISSSPSRYKVMALISRSRLQNSGSVHVCPPLGCSLIVLFCASNAYVVWLNCTIYGTKTVLTITFWFRICYQRKNWRCFSFGKMHCSEFRFQLNLEWFRR